MLFRSDFYTFLNSAASLWPYFNECARVGLNYAFSEHTQTQESSLQELYQSLRIPGKFAENRMLKATKGTNTHKGAVFSMGILCAAIGACGLSDWSSPEKILMTCSQMTSGLVDLDFSGLTLENAKTMGQKLYLNYGITGVRGEMEAGLPTVKNYGLPLLEQLLAEGKSIDETGAAVLLTILAHMTDTNLISRSDIETQKAAANTARELLQKNPCPSKAALEQLDQDFIQKNLSPGGSADLLAVCWMLYFIKTSGMDPEKKYRK